MVEVDMALSRRPRLCPNHPSPIALLPNIITSINIRSPDRSEVVKKARAITLVGSYCSAPGCPRVGEKLTPGPILPLFCLEEGLNRRGARDLDDSDSNVTATRRRPDGLMRWKYG